MQCYERFGAARIELGTGKIIWLWRQTLQGVLISREGVRRNPAVRSDE